MAGELLSSVLEVTCFLCLSIHADFCRSATIVTLLLPLPLKAAQSLCAQMQEVTCQENIARVTVRAVYICIYRWVTHERNNRHTKCFKCWSITSKQNSLLQLDLRWTGEICWLWRPQHMIHAIPILELQSCSLHCICICSASPALFTTRVLFEGIKKNKEKQRHNERREKCLQLHYNGGGIHQLLQYKATIHNDDVTLC